MFDKLTVCCLVSIQVRDQQSQKARRLVQNKSINKIGLMFIRWSETWLHMMMSFEGSSSQQFLDPWYQIEYWRQAESTQDTTAISSGNANSTIHLLQQISVVCTVSIFAQSRFNFHCGVHEIDADIPVNQRTQPITRLHSKILSQR